MSGIEPTWFWAALGCLLLLLELGLGGVGFLLGAGVAALLMMVITIPLYFSWTVQWMLYTVLTVGSTSLYWHFWNPRKIRTEDPLLNNRMGRIVGTKTKLIEPVENGIGKVQITDAHWVVKAAMDLPEGTAVEVVDYDGAVLIVRPC